MLNAFQQSIGVIRVAAYLLAGSRKQTTQTTREKQNVFELCYFVWCLLRRLIGIRFI